MAGWEVFNLTQQNLINNVFGDTTVYALFLVFSVISILLALRISPLLSFLIVVPLFLGTVGAGFFGGAGYIKAIIMLVMSIIWGFVLWRLIER